MIRKITSIFLMVCLIGLSTASRAVAAEVHSPDSTELLKQKMELLGIGANVRVKLADGQKVKGQVSSLEDTGFTLTPRSGAASRQVGYGEITELALLTKNYRASSAPDASEARRVIVALGVGQHVVVRTAEMKIHGQITAIERDNFVILPDDQANPVQIAYQNVEQAGRNLVYPGPNSNTFLAHIGREVPALGLDLPANAIGKDYRPLDRPVGLSSSGSGVQASLFGLLGFNIGWEEGIEINVLGLDFGVDFNSPALRLPFVGRIGMDDTTTDGGD